MISLFLIAKETRWSLDCSESADPRVSSATYLDIFACSVFAPPSAALFAAAVWLICTVAAGAWLCCYGCCRLPFFWCAAAWWTVTFCRESCSTWLLLRTL